MTRYRCADFLWLVAESDIVAPAEVPAGWGWLVRVGETLVQRRPAELLAVSLEQRDRLRRNLEIAAGVRAREPRGGPELLFAESA